MIHPRRSLLFMPGANARALEKGRNLAADGLILDLEDSVGPEDKPKAREQIKAALASDGYGRRELAVRINSLGTEWFAEDIQAMATAGMHAIVVPKVDSAAQIQQVISALDAAGGPADLPLWAMIETPLGVLNVAAIAGSHPRVRALVVGLEDLSKETRIRHRPDRLGFLPVLTQCVIAARAYGLDVLDTVYPDFRDEQGFAAVCEQSLDLGFDGKTLIHPNQIETANRVFSPDEKTVAAAREIIAAWDAARAAGKGITVLNGRMVEHLHVAEARRVLALHEAITRAEASA